MRQSWRLDLENKERWAAVGFVYLEDGRYSSIFLKPYPHDRPTAPGDWVMIANHRKLGAAKRAVESYASRKEFFPVKRGIRISRWETG
jgi:hypothetical protein